MVKFLQLLISSSNHFQVMLGNGGLFSCSSIYSQASIPLNNIPFHVDFYVLLISGGCRARSSIAENSRACVSRLFKINMKFYVE